MSAQQQYSIPFSYIILPNPARSSHSSLSQAHTPLFRGTDTLQLDTDPPPPPVASPLHFDIEPPSLPPPPSVSSDLLSSASSQPLVLPPSSPPPSRSPHRHRHHSTDDSAASAAAVDSAATTTSTSTTTTTGTGTASEAADPCCPAAADEGDPPVVPPPAVESPVPPPPTTPPFPAASNSAVAANLPLEPGVELGIVVEPPPLPIPPDSRVPDLLPPAGVGVGLQLGDTAAAAATTTNDPTKLDQPKLVLQLPTQPQLNPISPTLGPQTPRSASFFSFPAPTLPPTISLSTATLQATSPSTVSTSPRHSTPVNTLPTVAPLMETTIEDSIVRAAVYFYDMVGTVWWLVDPLSRVQLMITPTEKNPIYRIVAVSGKTGKVVINSPVFKDLVYIRASISFHQWSDGQGIYGLNFDSLSDEAARFSSKIDSAVYTLRKIGDTEFEKTVLAKQMMLEPAPADTSHLEMSPATEARKLDSPAYMDDLKKRRRSMFPSSLNTSSSAAPPSSTCASLVSNSLKSAISSALSDPPRGMTRADLEAFKSEILKLMQEKLEETKREIIEALQHKQ
ncbi:hypothetical protein Pelo_12517 [Pelomyxa schiedti]|nr:hypothetical protein Pelo_12517 [Pelomyxa schiedti]